MLNKFFGSKKKDDYYLEFGDAQDKKAPPAESKPAPKAAKAQPQTVAVAKPQTTTVAPPPPQPAPAPVKESAPLNPQVKTPAGVNFSTEYLMPQASTPRRRPGPSLAMFTDIANQINRS